MRASACASVVLPTPGMSSISRWPRASRQARHSRSCCSLPRMMRAEAGDAPSTSATVDASRPDRGAHALLPAACTRGEASRCSPSCCELPLELGERARAPASTTSGGALATKFALPSLAAHLSRSCAALRAALVEARDLGGDVVDQPRERRQHASRPSTMRDGARRQVGLRGDHRHRLEVADPGDGRGQRGDRLGVTVALRAHVHRRRRASAACRARRGSGGCRARRP